MTLKIYLPKDQMAFSVEETHWLELTPANTLPCQMQHIPTSLIFAIGDDLPDNPPEDTKFYPVREMYAWLIHACEGKELPPKDTVIELGQNALALWLMTHGYMGEVTQGPKPAGDDGSLLPRPSLKACGPEFG